MRFLVLGPVEVHTGDGRVLTLSRRHERCMLAILLLEPGRVVTTDRLCELLWEESRPSQARQAVRSYAARIRGVLAAADGEHRVTLISDRGGYLLTVAPDAVDAHRFRLLLDRATHTDDLPERDRLLREALALWRGPALHNAASGRVRDRICADLDELRLHAIEESLAVGLELGRHRDVLPELARLTGEHPLRERIVELYMRGLYHAGRTAEALDVYTRTRTQLADQLGLDPGAALQRLHRTILRGEPLPIPPSVRPLDCNIAPAQLPADQPGFSGRTDHLRQLDGVLTRAVQTAVVISGTAGVGKTTLAVHARR